MDRPRDYHAKCNKPNRNIIWYCLYMEPKKLYKWTSIQNRNKLTDINKQTYGYERGMDRGWDKLGDWN